MSSWGYFLNIHIRVGVCVWCFMSKQCVRNVYLKVLKFK
jgi:hypothetical protein